MSLVFEPVTVEIHDRERVVERFFTAAFQARSQGVVVTLDDSGRRLAEWAAQQRQTTARRNRYTPKGGQSVVQTTHDDCCGAYAEVGVVALTGLGKWNVMQSQFVVKEPDIGCTIQVRGASSHKHRLLALEPGEPEGVPYILATTEPPSPIVIVVGWAWGHEIKQRGEHKTFKEGRAKWWWLPRDELHDLSELPEDNFAWLRA